MKSNSSSIIPRALVAAGAVAVLSFGAVACSDDDGDPDDIDNPVDGVDDQIDSIEDEIDSIVEDVEDTIDE